MSVSAMGPQEKVEEHTLALPVVRARSMEIISGLLDEGPYWQKTEPRQLMPRAAAEEMWREG